MLRWSEVERSCDSSCLVFCSSLEILPLIPLLSVSFHSKKACVLLYRVTFDPDIEKVGNFERAYPDCGLLPDMLFCCPPQEQLAGELTSCLVLESSRKVGR